MNIIQAPSPNFNERKFPLDMLVLHYTGMEDGPSALERMRDAAAEVSSHYMVDVDGTIYQLVDEEMRAWHAGRSGWQGDEDLNSRSIGIEIVNGGHNIPLPDGSLPPYAKVQIDAVIELSKSIIDRHGIPQDRVVGHSDIAPVRKEDPGEHFPWEELAERGVGYWPDIPTPEQVQEWAHQLGPLTSDSPSDVIGVLQAQLQAIGFPIELTSELDDQTVFVLIAFQRRWNQSFVTGKADPLTQMLVMRVADFVIQYQEETRPVG